MALLLLSVAVCCPLFLELFVAWPVSESQEVRDLHDLGQRAADGSRWQQVHTHQSPCTSMHHALDFPKFVQLHMLKWSDSASVRGHGRFISIWRCQIIWIHQRATYPKVVCQKTHIGIEDSLGFSGR